MKTFIGTKQIKAFPMDRAEYNDYRGWELPADERGEDAGYLVEYVDGGEANDHRHKGYISWSPANVFAGSYQDTSIAMSFGHAIELLKQGHKVTRAGWNGKGLFVVYQKGYLSGIPCNKQTAEAWNLQEGDLFVVNPYLQLRCANGSHSMWVPSINDCLANDWLLVVE